MDMYCVIIARTVFLNQFFKRKYTKNIKYAKNRKKIKKIFLP